MNPKRDYSLLVPLILVAFWVGTAWYRYGSFKTEGQAVNQKRIEDYPKLPPEVRSLTTVPVDGDVQPRFQQLLFWPWRKTVTCGVYVEGKEWTTFDVTLR